MTKNEILAVLTGIFRDVLDNEKLVLTNETQASDVDDWDSLSHINLISSIQSEFKMKFNLSEIQALKNVGGMVDLIFEKKK